MEKLNLIQKGNYIFKGPFRFVEKYDFTYKTYVKNRWINEKLIDILAKEFRSYSYEYFKEVIKEGKIKINGLQVDENYRLKDSQVIEQSVQRLEDPILNLKPTIIYEDQDILVVDKPPDCLCHASSEILYNSLPQILKNEFSIETEIHPIHRLDKVTSGIVIYGKHHNLKHLEEEDDENNEKQDDSQIKMNIQKQKKEQKKLKKILKQEKKNLEQQQNLENQIINTKIENQFINSQQGIEKYTEQNQIQQTQLQEQQDHEQKTNQKNQQYLNETEKEYLIQNQDNQQIQNDSNYLYGQQNFDKDKFLFNEENQGKNKLNEKINKIKQIEIDLNLLKKELDEKKSNNQKNKVINENSVFQQESGHKHKEIFKQKEYLARVKGNFIYEQKEVTLKQYQVTYRNPTHKIYEGDDQNEEEIKKLKVKEGTTLFEKIWYDEKTDSSLIKCLPKTGRTHQIRLHLSFLGFPIINDIKYNGPFIGNLVIKKYFPQIWQENLKTVQNYQLENNFQHEIPNIAQTENQLNEQQKQIKNISSKQFNFYSEPLEIFLHAYKYQLNKEIFQTQLPYWAEINFELN